MNQLGLRKASRSTLDDAEKPYLWSDDELDRWGNNAVREVCIRARLLKDDALSRPGICNVEVEAGHALVKFDTSILAVRAGTYAGAGHKLHAVSSDDMDKLRPGWEAPTDEQGPPCMMVMDLAQKTLRLWPTPSTAFTLQLRVWRVPTGKELMQAPTDTPIVALPDPESLVHWVCFEAYMKKDGETFDEGLAGDHLALFEKRFGARPSFHDMMRWADTPPRVRRAVMF